MTTHESQNTLSEHLSESELQDAFLSRLEGAKIKSVFDHLSHCNECQEKLNQISRQHALYDLKHDAGSIQVEVENTRNRRIRRLKKFNFVLAIFALLFISSFGVVYFFPELLPPQMRFLVTRPAGSPDKLFEQANSFIKANQYREALVVLKAVMKYYPKFHEEEVIYNLGFCYEKLDRHAAALMRYKKLKDLNPAYPGIDDALARAEAKVKELGNIPPEKKDD